MSYIYNFFISKHQKSVDQGLANQPYKIQEKVKVR
jgi:hypothetical protein